MPSATLSRLFYSSAANADAKTTEDGNKMQDFCAAHDGLSQLDSFSLYLRQRNIDKWGLVVYRCSYKHDAVWARVKEVIKS